MLMRYNYRVEYVYNWINSNHLFKFHTFVYLFSLLWFRWMFRISKKKLGFYDGVLQTEILTIFFYASNYKTKRNSLTSVGTLWPSVNEVHKYEIIKNLFIRVPKQTWNAQTSIKAKPTNPLTLHDTSMIDNDRHKAFPESWALKGPLKNFSKIP